MVPSVLSPIPDPSVPCGDSPIFPKQQGLLPPSPLPGPSHTVHSGGPPVGGRGHSQPAVTIKSPAQSLPAVAHDSTLCEGVGEACCEPQHHHVALPKIPDFLLLHVHIPDVIQLDHHCGAWQETVSGPPFSPALPTCVLGTALWGHSPEDGSRGQGPSHRLAVRTGEHRWVGSSRPAGLS